jgi:hypothetical protein
MRWFIITDEIVENVKQKDKEIKEIKEEKPKNLRYLQNLFLVSKL